jgi:hypothetical protein
MKIAIGELVRDKESPADSRLAGEDPILNHSCKSLQSSSSPGRIHKRFWEEQSARDEKTVGKHMDLPLHEENGRSDFPRILVLEQRLVALLQVGRRWSQYLFTAEKLLWSGRV